MPTNKENKGTKVVNKQFLKANKKKEIIKQSEEKYRQLFNSMTDMFVAVKLSYFVVELIHDKNGKPVDVIYREVNPITAQLIGKNREQIIGKSRKELFGDVNDEFPQRFDNVAKTGKPAHFETYGAALQKYYNVYAWKVGENRVGVILTDMTESKKTEEALRESEERFRLALKNSPVSMAAQDCNLRYVWAYNQRTADPTHIIGKLDREIFPKQEAVHIDTVKRRVLKENIELREQLWLERPSGRIFLDITWSPIHGKNGEVIGVASATVDLTGMKEIEDRLKESEQRWSTTLESIGDAVIATDVLGKVTFMNGGAEELTGWKLSEASNKPIKEVFNIVNEQTRLEVENPIRRVLKDGIVVGLANHTVLIRKDCTEVPIDDSGAPIKNKEGKTTGVVLIFRDISERKKSEKALEKQATLIALSPDAIIGKKLDDTITFWSQGAQNLYGWTKEEALGKKSRSLLRTKFPEPYHIIIKALLSEGRWSGEKIHKDKLGNEIIVESRWLASCNNQNEIEEILETNVDITERKKLELETQRLLGVVQQERDRAQSLLNSINDEVWFADTEKKFTLANPSAIKEFKLDSFDPNIDVENLAASSEVYRPDGSLRPVEESPPLRALKGEIVRNQEEIVRTPLKGEMRTRQVSSAPVRNSSGTIVGSVSVVRDVTELKKSEETLKENERLYRTVFDNSQDGFQLIELIYDKKGKPIDHKFLKVNRAYEKIIGVKAEDILDKTAKYISPNQEPHWLDVPDRVAKTGISEHVELYNKDINKTLDCYYFPYSTNVIGTLFRDVSERKKMEKQLQDQERLAAIGATAGMVGHDIRNPLQAITGDVFLAKTDLALTLDSEEKKNALESLDEIEKNVVYINKIVADLQDFARPLKPNAEETDLKLIIDDLLSKNGLPENIKVSVKVETGKVVADSTFINRILYNLVNNAVQAMPKGGKLTIRTYKEVNNTVISVKDTGVGIPEAVKGKLFTPMFTTKSKGQGFGLAVIKRMTESLGGTVTFMSEEGKGTTFIIRLPPPPRS